MFRCCLRKNIFNREFHFCLGQTKLDFNNGIGVRDATLDDGKPSLTLMFSRSVECFFRALNNDIKALFLQSFIK